MREWRGLVKILELVHSDSENRVLWRAENLHNILHSEGEEFVLNALFLGGNDPNEYVPDSYYFGLDARSTVGVADTMADVSDAGEPTTNSYSRQSVASTGAFTIVIAGGVNQANSPIISFHASGGAWGPVNNLFLTDDPQYAGSLIATVPLSQPITVNDGDTISMRMGLALRDCPT